MPSLPCCHQEAVDGAGKGETYHLHKGDHSVVDKDYGYKMHLGGLCPIKTQHRLLWIVMKK